MIKGKVKGYSKRTHIALDGCVFKVKYSRDGESLTLKRVDELENPKTMLFTRERYEKEGLFALVKSMTDAYKKTHKETANDNRKSKRNKD